MSDFQGYFLVCPRAAVNAVGRGDLTPYTHVLFCPEYVAAL